MTLFTNQERHSPNIGIPDLSANIDQLEWWFIQGSIDSRQLPHQHFMLSFFRQAGLQDGGDGHMLLAATLDTSENKHRVVSKVSPQFVENFNQGAPGKVKTAPVDQVVAGAILSEIAKDGPPRPIQLADEDAIIASSPFSIEWGDFKLEQHGDLLEVSFLLPGTDRHCRLRAEPRIPWFEGRNLGGEKTGFMAYDCCPRLSLTGELDGKPLSGRAWVDHQWGGYDWVTAPDDVSIVLGWEWLGMNLDDGRDVIVMVHRDMRTFEPVEQFAVLFDETGNRQFVDNAKVTGTGTWRSPATMIDYPIRCTVEIPDLSASIEFDPLADNQEIPVFGLDGAIWEGAGTVAGTISGQAVSGRARLELHGYGYVCDFEAYQGRWVERIERTIAGFLPHEMDRDHLVSYLGKPRWAYCSAAQGRMLSEPVWDLMSRGGKHWRPIVGLLLLETLGTDVSPHELMLSTVPELIHNGSIIIDDIEDSSLTRRGEETIHRRYGLPTAINAGNSLYFMPLLTVAQNTDLATEQKNAIYQVTIDMLVRAHFGQAQDLYWGQLPSTTVIQVLGDPETRPLIMQAHAFKSAAAVKGVAEIACIIAKADEETRRACVRLAESWGLAFQITDDINNFSTSHRWGKLRGEDVREGKVTYVTHSAIQLSSGADKGRLLEILTTRDLRQSEDGLSEAIALIEQSGALEASRRDAENLYTTDWPAFSRLLPNSQSKFMLRALLDKLLGGPFEM